ncbi:MAG: hypothetical protein Q7J48_07130 [Nocardioides sp.]|nr:hypothetical protein [Nocardioides sp.]
MLKLLVFVALFAVAVYIVTRLAQQRGGGRPAPRRRPAPPPPPRVMGPDDDEDFLRDLDRKRLNPEDPDTP